MRRKAVGVGEARRAGGRRPRRRPSARDPTRAPPCIRSASSVASLRTKPFTRSSTSTASRPRAAACRAGRRARARTRAPGSASAAGRRSGRGPATRWRRSTARCARPSASGRRATSSPGSGDRRRVGEGRVDHVGEQLVLRRHVAIEGHRSPRPARAPPGSSTRAREAVATWRRGCPASTIALEAEPMRAASRRAVLRLPCRRHAGATLRGMAFSAHRLRPSVRLGVDFAAKAYIIRLYAYDIRFSRVSGRWPPCSCW